METFKGSEKSDQLQRAENPPILVLHGTTSMARPIPPVWHLADAATSRVLRNRGSKEESSISPDGPQLLSRVLAQCVENALCLMAREFGGEFLDAQLTQARHAAK